MSRYVVNRRDWSQEKMASGLLVSVGKQVTEEFLSWYFDWLLEHEPKATHSHAEISNILGLLQGDLNEVLKTE